MPAAATGSRSTSASARNSSRAAPGRFVATRTRACTSDAHTLRTRARSIAGSGWLASSVNSALRRSRRAGCSAVMPISRTPRRDASAWYTTASVAVTTRCPAACTRQQKSRSSRKIPYSMSKPPRRSHTSRRTSIPALPTARTSRTPSCWPWSNSSRSRPRSRRPVASTVTPSSRSTRRSSQSRTFGPSTAMFGSVLTVRSSCASASWAGAESSCRSQIHSVRWLPGSSSGTGADAASCRSASAIASP